MMQTSNAGISHRELLVFFYKYRIRLLLAFLIPFLLTVIVSFMPVPRYTAQSVLIVRLGSEYVYQPEVTNSQSGQNLAIPFNQDQIFKSEVAILNSDELHEQVIRAIGIETMFPEIIHPTGLARLKSWLMDDGTLSATETQRRLWAKAVARFAKRFDITLEKDSAVIKLTFEHRDDQVAARTLEMLLVLYQQKRKLLYMEPRAGAVESSMQEKQARALSADLAMESFKRKNRLHSLEEQRAELLARRNEALRQSTVINHPSIKQNIAAYNSQLDALDGQEREWENLKREAQVANDAYTLYSRKFDEAAAYEQLQHTRDGSVRIIQNPSVSAEPRRLQFIILLAGFFGSLLSLMLTAAVTEFARNGFLTPERLESQMGLPVLAVFPYRRL